MALTQEQIDNIHLGRKAVLNKVYSGPNGNLFVGISGGFLRLQQQGDDVVLNDAALTESLGGATNVNQALKELEDKSRLAVTEVEIDFGGTPVSESSFLIIDANISLSSKIIVSPSGNVAAGRVGNDYSWETFSFSATSGKGNFTLYANCSNGFLVGRRKIYYTFS